MVCLNIQYNKCQVDIFGGAICLVNKKSLLSIVWKFHYSEMALENNYLNNSTTSSLRVCRGCLATDARLYDMRQHRLMEAYNTLLSNAVQVTDDLPRYLCSYCAALLLKCDAFRTKCVDSLTVLTNAQQHFQLTTENIKAIDRPTYFKRTEFQRLSIEDNYTNHKQIYSDICTDTDTDIISDSGESIDSDDLYVDECLVSDKEEKSEHDYVENHSDDEIKCLLKKYSDNIRSVLLKDFKVNINFEASENISNIRAHHMHQLSEIINHIQYSSEKSNELMNTLDEGILKWENDGSKFVNNTTEKCKVVKRESESNVKANTINEQGVAQIDEEHARQEIVKGNINKSVLESQFNILPVIIKNVDSNAKIRHSLQKDHIKIDVPQDKPFFKTQCDEINETFEFEDDIEIKVIDFKLDDSDEEIPNSLKNDLDDSDEEIPHSLQNDLDDSDEEIAHSLQNDLDDSDEEISHSLQNDQDDSDEEIPHSLQNDLDDSDEEIPHSLQNDHINIDLPQDKPLFKTQCDEINETFEFEDDIEIKVKDCKLDDSNEEIPHSLQNEHTNIDVPQDKPFFETQCDEINETFEIENDIEIGKPLNCKNISNNSKKVAPNNIIKQTRRKMFTDKYLLKYNIEVRHLSIEEQKKEINDRKSDNLEYRKSYQEKQFQCNICFKRYLIEDSYKNHMLAHDDISGKFVCDICQCHFMTKLRLKNHKPIHYKVFTCKDCGYTMKSGSAAVAHYKNHIGSKYSCKDCGKEFKHPSSKYKHTTTLHKNCTLSKLVRCEICGGLYNGLTGLIIHCNMAHQEMTSPECLCSGCGTQFYCSDAFKAHQGTDGLCDTIHKYCVRCGMSFETEELLKEHEIEQRKPQNNVTQTRVHKRESPFKCQICRKSFQSAHILKHHGIVHTGERPYLCDICGKTFQTKSIVTLHIKTVHLKIPRNRRTKLL